MGYYAAIKMSMNHMLRYKITYTSWSQSIKYTELSRNMRQYGHMVSLGFDFSLILHKVLYNEHISCYIARKHFS